MQSGKSVIQNLAHNEADADASEEEREVFVKLQSRLRQLEKDREVQRWQAKYQIQQQEQQIEKLMAEQDRLKRELVMKKAGLEHSPHQDNADKLRELITNNSHLDKELETEELKQQGVNSEISEWQQKILDLKKEGIDPKERQRLRRKNIRAERLLEDKLQKSKTHLNKQMITNRELREELQTMVGQRTISQRSLKTRKKQLRELQEQIKDDSKEYLGFSEATIQSHRKKATLREKLVTERAEYNTEIQRLQLINSYETDLTLFLWSKQDEREFVLDHSNRQESKAKNIKETLMDVFRSVSGEEDLDKLVKNFIQAENQNFALFKFVNEQNKDIVALKDEIEQVKKELDKSAVRHRERKQKHKAKMEELSKQLHEEEARTELYEKLTSQKSSVLDQIKTGLNSICRAIACDSDNDLSSCLRALEKRTNEMLSIKAWVDKEQSSKNYSKHEDI